MNETRVYADGFTKTFAEEGDFLTFLKNRKEETSWLRSKANSLRFEAIRKDTMRADELADEYRAAGKEEVLDDTLSGTQLMLSKHDDCYRFIRESGCE